MFVTEKFHSNIKSKYYIRPKSDAVCFSVHHFAGKVFYHADGFLEKNRNFLPADVIQLIRQSQYDVVRYMFQCPITKTGNLYSAMQDEKTQRQNLVNVDTKVSDKIIYFLVISMTFNLRSGTIHKEWLHNHVLNKQLQAIFVTR